MPRSPRSNDKPRMVTLAGELRVTGGRLARRRFRVPEAADQGRVRPTGDRIREALFSSLQPFLAAYPAGARVLDVFAGSGALGIESLSRGAKHVVFIEKDPKVVRVVRGNLEALELANQTEVLAGEAWRHVRSMTDESFDLVLVDPPYAMALPAEGLHALCRVLAPGGYLVIERDAKTPEIELPDLTCVRNRVYGSTRVCTWEKSEG